MVSRENLGLAEENERLLRENRILKDLQRLKIVRGTVFPPCEGHLKSHGVLREPKTVRFKFIEAHQSSFFIGKAVDVSPPGLRAF